MSPLRGRFNMGSGNLRNEPCDCGSGRKFKKCCGREEAPPKTLNDKIVDFTMSPLPPRELQAAWEEWGEDGSFKSAGTHRFGLFVDWLVSGRRRGGKTAMERFEEAHGGSLTEAERAELATHKAIQMAVLEVLELRPGVGVRVKDIFSGEEFDAHDKSASRGAPRWSVIAVRMRRENGPAEFWGEASLFSPLEKAELKFDLEAAYGEAKVHEPGLSWQAYLNSAPGVIKRLLVRYRSGRTVSANLETLGPLPEGMGPEAILAGMALARGKKWPDEPVPALGGRTPRQAAKDEEGRGFLRVLLKEFEGNQGRRAGKTGVADIMNVPAIAWMREALGLEVGPELVEALKRLEEAAA